MARADQLEIINADGEVLFHDLDPNVGITNLGRHPENDVVIDSPHIAMFQAVLDHRQKPFSLVVLSDEGDISVGGERILINQPTPLHNFDTIQMDGVSVVVMEGEGEGGEPAGAATAAATAAAGAAAAEGAAKGKTAVRKATHAPEPVYQILGAPPPDRVDDIILLELPERAFTIECQQTAVWRLTVINAGPLVAELTVKVTDIEDNWLQILPPKVNLNEGQRSTVTITITPPRTPTSRAGNHHFAIVVTSPDYPGHTAQLGATLTINPFYDYGVGELSPRQRTVGYTRQTGQYTVSIANKGNSAVPYEVSGEDDQHACSFEFHVPGEEVGLARQATVRVEPDQVMALPVHVSPLKRRLVGLRKVSYSLTVTTTPGEGEQSPRAVLGQIFAGPLIGPWLIILIVIILALLIVWIFHPWIGSFTVQRLTPTAGTNSPSSRTTSLFTLVRANPDTGSLGSPNNELAISAGESARLSWTASQFVSLRIEPDVGVVDGPSGSKIVSPSQSTTYQLIAENFLSKISDTWFKATNSIQLTVNPVYPVINTFASDKSEVVVGQDVVVYWDVVGATDVQLTINNAPETLQSSDYRSSRTMKLTQDTTFVLKAANQYTTNPVQRSFTVRVNPPTPTPIPTPNVIQFDVNPKVITDGQSVTLQWNVAGVNSVQISSIPGSTSFPPQGNISTQPHQTVVYVLTAGVGDSTVTRQWQVIVNPAPPTPTPTPVPKAPVIEFFTITPNQVVKGDPAANQIALSWSVLTGTTNIEITSPDMQQPLSNLQNQGNIFIAASKTTLYVLTAYNGDLKTSATTNLTVLDPTPTPTSPPPPPPTPTPYPPPIIQSFVALADPNDSSAQVTQVFSTGLAPNTTLFQVKYGSHIVLNWTTSNAQTVMLAGLGSQPLSGSTITPIQITAPTQFQLQAMNPSPASPATAYVQIILQPKPIPPPPYNIYASNQTTASVTIHWSYNPAWVSQIVGFRIYRAPQASGAFVRVASELTLTSTVSLWTDTASPVCGQQYYVVGVYLDTFGNPQETAVGTPTILTNPCAVAGLQNSIPSALTSYRDQAVSYTMTEFDAHSFTQTERYW